MQKVLSLLVIASLTTGVAFAATGDSAMSPTSPVIAPTMQMNAAAASTSMSLGENKSVTCASNTAFGTNSCDECFDGGSVTVGKRLTGLFDNWTNNTTGFMIAYQSEQKNPNMVAFGATTWTASPADESKLWKSSSDIIWSPSQTGSTKMQYVLAAGQKVKFVEADLAAGYTLTKTDRKNGDLVGMMKYPIVAHVLEGGINVGAAKTHIECVAYNLSAAPVVMNPTTPVTPGKPPVKPVTPEITKTATGPAETIILILAAFFIAFGLMFSLRKRI